MPDRTPDPIRDLENFATGGIAVTPLEPAQVRQLGNRRRRRRQTAILAGAVVAVLAIVTPVAVIAGKGDDGTPPVLGTPQPVVITYNSPGIEVVTPADAAKLTGTTNEFQDFIGAEATKAAADGAECPGAAHGVTVQKFSSAGYAMGSVSSCGGYVALWAEVDGQWKEAVGTQDILTCAELAKYGVPRTFAGGCYDEKTGKTDLAGEFGPTTVEGLELGMTSDQVSTAGGTVLPGGSGCRGLTLPGRMEVKDATDGYLSPTKGLVALFARDDMRTPAGIGLVSDRSEVRAAYPGGHLDATHGAWISPIDDTSAYRFDFDQKGVVTTISIFSLDQDCYE